jgi:hypothetical protein
MLASSNASAVDNNLCAFVTCKVEEEEFDDPDVLVELEGVVDDVLDAAAAE